MTIRIAMIAASASILGGHSVQAKALTDELRNDGYDVDSIAIDAQFPRGLRWIKRVPYLRTMLNELLYLASLARIASADVVHVFSASYWSFLLAPAPAILIARLLHKPVIVHYHSGEADDHLTRSRVAIPLLRLANEIVVPSQYLQRVFASHGMLVRVIHNVVDTSRFRKRHRCPVRPSLLSVRNLEMHYAVENTIAAFAMIKMRFPSATLTIAGYGSLERSLRQFAAELGLSGIHFLGRVEPADLPAIYDSADVFVNSSIIDNQPVSILEAFAAGMPVVSTPTGDIASMLREGEAGLVIEPRNPAALANAVTWLVEEPPLAQRVAECASLEVQAYTWRAVGDQWKSLYAELLSGGRLQQLTAAYGDER